jgi:hypothetical protein
MHMMPHVLVSKVCVTEYYSIDFKAICPHYAFGNPKIQKIKIKLFVFCILVSVIKLFVLSYTYTV